MAQLPSPGAAAIGVGSATFALGAGHLVAAAVAPPASPAVAVASTLVDRAPRAVKEWAISTLGTADKPALVAGVVLVVLALGALAGVLQPRRRLGTWIFVALGVLSAAAALTRPDAGPVSALPTLAAVAAGTLTLRTLLPSRSRFDPVEMSIRGRQAVSPPPQPPSDPVRRTLLTAGALTAAGGGLAYLGMRLGAGTAGSATSFALPAPARPLPPLPAGLEATVPGLSALRTPVADFYRVDTALVLPRIDAADWRLRIDGDVDRNIELTFDDLLAMPMVEADITLNCVSNPVGGEYIGSTRWLGVLTRDVLARAGVRPTADQILSTSQDGMTISTPVAALTDARGAMLAVAMDGKPLTREHGYPVRMVTPGLYGYVGAPKWLTRLTATTYAAEKAYWSTRGWAERAEVKTQARIDVPRRGETVAEGQAVVAGVAWSQAHQGISRVEVRVDEGPWQEAELGPDVGGHYWRQWRWTWEAHTGGRRLTVRATDGEGTIQSGEIAEPAPDGASGLHMVNVRVN